MVSGHQAIHWEPVPSASKHAVQAFTVTTSDGNLPVHGVRIGAIIAPGKVLDDGWGYDDSSDTSTEVDDAPAGLPMKTSPTRCTTCSHAPVT